MEAQRKALSAAALQPVMAAQIGAVGAEVKPAVMQQPVIGQIAVMAGLEPELPSASSRRAMTSLGGRARPWPLGIKALLLVSSTAIVEWAAVERWASSHSPVGRLGAAIDDDPLLADARARS